MRGNGYEYYGRRPYHDDGYYDRYRYRRRYYDSVRNPVAQETAQGSLQCVDRGLQGSEPTDDQDDCQPEHLLANHVSTQHVQG